MRSIVLLGLAFGACAPAEAPRAPSRFTCAEERPSTLSGRRADALEHVMDDAVTRFPGAIAAAVTSEGTWFSARGVADLDTQAPMQPCTRMRVASVSKTFVSLAVLRLVDRGVLDLDARAASVLPPADVRDLANADRATIRQLLNHTSGIPHGLDDPGIALSLLFDDPTRRRTPRDSLDRVRGLPAAFPPGEGWGYSNSNYNLLGLVLEAASGQPLSDVLRAEVIGPLGLSGSSYLSSEGPIPARGYLDYQGNGTLIDSSDFTMGIETPAGGVVSTAFDLTRLLAAAAREPRLQTWVDVPPGKAVAPNHTGYGLGLMRWKTAHGDALGHGGELFGWQTWAFTFPERGVTWVMLANADFGRASDDFHRLQDTAIEALFE